MLKQIVRHAGTALIGAFPSYLWRRLIRILLEGLAHQEPGSALRTLLEIEVDLSERIDQAAIRYDGGIHVKHRLMRYHDFFVERVQPGERVLDIGCGVGAVAYSLAARAGAHVTGVDINARNLAIARQRFQHPHLTFIQGDALQPLLLGNHETIVLSNVLEHIEHRVVFLKTIQHTVQPKRWLIRVPMINRHWLVPLRQELGLPYFSDSTHYTEYTQQSFEDEMQSAGLHITTMQINWGEIWAELQPGSATSPTAQKEYPAP